MKKAVVVLSIAFILLLLVSGIAAAGFWQDVTGMFSLSKLFKPKVAQQTILPAEKAITTECKAYIDGKCATELQPKLNINLQKSAKAYSLESQKAKTVSGKAVKVSKTEKTITRNVKIGMQTNDVKVPVVNVCIGSKCKDYGLDEIITINGIVYDLMLSKDKINLLPQGISLISPHEEDISEIEIPPLKPMIQPKIKIVTPSLSPMLTSHIFKIGFIIDRDTVPTPQASREEIQEAIRLANNKLRLHNVNIRFELQDIQNINMGGYDTYGESDTTFPYTYIDNYYFEHASSPPNGVIIFREDPIASSYGGYAVGSSNLMGFGFCNNFRSPVYGQSIIYGSVIDFDSMYAACGYDDHENHISDIPLIRESGDRECVRSTGLPCVLHNGYYMCNDIDFKNNEYARTRLSFLANTFIHEFLHLFHPTRESLSSYHFGNLDCPVVPCDCFQEYSGMCPVTWENFANSWQSSCISTITSSSREVSPIFTGRCRTDADCRAGQRCQLSTGRCLSSGPVPST